MLYDPNKEEYDKLGYESDSDGTFCTGLRGLLRGVELSLGVKIYDDE